MAPRDITLKGVARRYLFLTGDISVKNDILGGVSAGQTKKVRSTLQDIATVDIGYRERECTFRWDVSYQQSWAHITVRIIFDEQDSFSVQELEDAKALWKSSIESTWSGKWAVWRAGEAKCRFSFRVIFTNFEDKANHEVELHRSIDQVNMTNWEIVQSGRAAAHEYGHMIGHPDEYRDADCPDRDPVNTGTIMDTGTAIPKRLMELYAPRLGCEVVAV